MKFSLRPEIYTSKWPPKGWRYRQPETRWQTPTPLIDNFASTVQKIIQHRKANPGHNLPFDTPTVESDLMTYTALRILQESPEHADEWVIAEDDEAAQKKTLPTGITRSPHRPGVGAALAGVVARFKRDVAGAKILAEWLGEGGDPVPVPLANRRGMVCASCPHNVPGYKFEAAVAEAIREHESARATIRLATTSDHKLETCELCGCYLKLKVWMPIAKVIREKPPEDLPDFCWIKREAAEEESGTLRVAYHGYIFDPTGFGSAARSYITALLDAGARVTVSDRHRHSRSQYDERLQLLQPINWGANVHIVHGIPTEFNGVFSQPITAVAMTAWETDRIHPKWVPILNKCAEVWVPCEHNRKAFAAKLRVPVVTVPHPAPPVSDDPPWELAIPEWNIKEDDFVFYSIFVWQIRKAPESMLAAYLRAFDADSSITFVLKMNPGCLEAAKRELARLRAKTKSAARVVLIGETWPDSLVTKLHERGNCYVSLHRGEGFNLPCFEAACRGRAVIATNYSGPVDYLDPHAHCLIPFDMVPVKQLYQFYSPDMMWAEPSVAKAADAMRLLESHRFEEFPYARQIAPAIRKRFSLEKVGETMMTRLKRL